MENLTFETQGTTTYLVYEVLEQDELDTMSLGMLTNNRIPGFAAASYMQIDTTRYIKYNVSAKVSAKQLFSGPVNKKRLLGIFSGVVDAILNAEEYMLDYQTILLDLDYIFADVSTCTAELICLPIMNNREEQMPLEMFFKNILFTTQFDQTENCDHVAQLINYLNGNPVLSLTDFRDLLQDLAGGSKTVVSQQVQAVSSQPAVQPRAVAQPTVAPVANTAQVAPAASATAPQKQSPKPSNIPAKAPTAIPQQQMQIPGGKAPVENVPQSGDGEKEISWLYLMQPYNKEKAAVYKAQQEAKKQRKNDAPAKAAPKQKAAPVPAKQPTAPGFAIPGQPAQIGSGAVSTAPKAAQAEATKTCSNCGAPLRPNAAFCGACGARCGETTPRQQVVQPQVQQPVQQVVAPVSSPSQGMPLNFGETTVLGGSIGETTVLGGGMPVNQPDPHLIRTKNNERIPLNKPVFRIGKERSYVDYFISDNTAISRSHANIVNHNGEFFVVDTNSTNHTYVNGAMIPSGQETKLAHGDKIRLANEDFEFRLY